MHVAMSSTEPQAAAAPLVPATQSDTLRILVIDDDRALTARMSLDLKGLGCVVNVAATPEAAGSPGRDGSEVVEKLLATLNPVEQMVLRMLDLEQKSVKEIVELTDWTASKIKVAAMRARRKLAETLKRLEGQPA